MKFSPLLLLFAIFFLPQTGLAKNYDISSVAGLTQACQNILNAEQKKPYDERSYGLCFGYIRGVKNSYDIRKEIGGGGGNICTSAGGTWLQYIETFVKWSRRNPKMRNKMAWTGVVTALSEAYPCAHR